MRVLVAFDGSALAERALAAVAPLVGSGGNDVALIAVLDPDEIHGTVAGAGHRLKDATGVGRHLAMRGAPVEPLRALAEDRGQALEAARTEAEDGLLLVAARYLDPAIPRSVHIEWAGDAAEAIARYAGESGADLIAISSHGRSGLSQLVMGSVASALVRKSPVPLLLVGASTRLPARA